MDGSRDSAGDPRRWAVLCAGVIAMTAGSTFQFGLPYLIPTFRSEGLTLMQAGLLAACPTAGLLLTLVAWGAAADRLGERLVVTVGMALAAMILLISAVVRGPVPLALCFVLAGAAGASVYAASGRLILGWFPVRQRGAAMGVRHTAQPLGIAIAALVLPSLAARGLAVPLIFLAGLCLVAAVVAVRVIRDPVRAYGDAYTHHGSPYGTPVLWRIHAASALLVVPQFTVATYALVFLVDQYGWGTAPAGRLLAASQMTGAGARLAVGFWSDRFGSRMRPMRTIAVTIAVVLAALAIGAFTRSPLAVVALLVAAVVTVTPNGLAYTAVAEYSGRAWAGRALGIQNTAQNVMATATPPVIAMIISGAGYGTAFATIVALPLLAAAIVPAGARRPHGPPVPVPAGDP